MSTSKEGFLILNYLIYGGKFRCGLIRCPVMSGRTMWRRSSLRPAGHTFEACGAINRPLTTINPKYMFCCYMLYECDGLTHMILTKTLMLVGEAGSNI